MAMPQEVLPRVALLCNRKERVPRGTAGREVALLRAANCRFECRGKESSEEVAQSAERKMAALDFDFSVVLYELIAFRASRNNQPAAWST